MRKPSLFWSIITLSIVTIIIIILFDVYTIDKQPGIGKAVVLPPNLTDVLAVNLDANLNPQNVTQFHNGDAILVARTTDAAGQPQAVLVTYAMLQELDINGDGRVDQQEPGFRSFELLFYDEKTGAFTFVPIQQAGIRAIYLGAPRWGRTPVSPNIHALGITYPHSAVIMADGSARYIRSVGVSFLP